MRTAIIDDEPLAIKLLELHARRIPQIELVGRFTSAKEALATLTEHPVDLVFLDIQMPGCSGMELARQLPPQTMIIFTTAFPRYALESYSVGAVHYLLKPISYDDFAEAVRRATDRMSQLATRPDDGYFFVRHNHRQERILLREVLYVEGLKDYVKICMRQRNIVTHMSMKAVEAKLTSSEFMRIHRSFIVHITLATSIQSRHVYFGERCIPVSESYREALAAYMVGV